MISCRSRCLYRGLDPLYCLLLKLNLTFGCEGQLTFSLISTDWIRKKVALVTNSSQNVPLSVNISRSVPCGQVSSTSCLFALSCSSCFGKSTFIGRDLFVSFRHGNNSNTWSSNRISQAILDFSIWDHRQSCFNHSSIFHSFDCQKWYQLISNSWNKLGDGS